MQASKLTYLCHHPLYYSAPSYYHFRTENLKTGVSTMGLLAIVVPISPGRSRIFLSPAPYKRFPKIIPLWLVHSLLNSFLDTDIWIHDQERFQRSGGNSFLDPNTVVVDSDKKNIVSKVGDKYVLTTQSDSGCIAWRKWWRTHMLTSPIFGEPSVAIPWMSKEQQVDRYEAHAKQCTSCNGAEKKASFAKKYAPFLGIFLASIAPNAILKTLGIVVALVVHEVAERVRRSILGPARGAITSAAQFPEKPSKA